jgi:5'-nucleotidase
MKFKFDPSKPPGERILKESVFVCNEELCEKLQLDRLYSLATKEYLAQGKDGYECLEVCMLGLTFNVEHLICSTSMC